MFQFNLLSVNMNFKSDEMEGTIAPTDTRFRNDMRLYEEGKVDEADEEKIRLEVKQRKARKLREEAGGVWEPNFFKEVAHPFIEGEKQYVLRNDNNYFDRRERKNWEGLPDLF